MTALVEEAEEAKEDTSVNPEVVGPEDEETGRQTPEVVMTGAMPDPVKESPKTAKKPDKAVVPKMRLVKLETIIYFADKIFGLCMNSNYLKSVHISHIVTSITSRK